MLRRSLVMASVLLLVSLSWCWRFARATGGQGGSEPASSQVAFEVPVRGERAVWELEADDPHQYGVIVSSLGDASYEYRVQLQSGAGNGRVAEPLRSVRTLRRGLPRPRVTNAPPASAGSAADTVAPAITTSDIAVREKPDREKSGHEKSGHETSAPREKGMAASAKTATNLTPVETWRTFDIHTGAGRLEDPASYTRVRARLVAECPTVRIFLDEQHRREQLADGLLEEISHWLDQRVLPRSREVWGGTHHDIDGDGKLAVLLTPWLGRLQGGETALWGFVRGSDFRHDMQAPFSNQADVIYLNTALTPGSMLRTVLAHEYTHAVSFSLRLHPAPGRPELPDEEDWLTEGFAHVAETLHDSGWANLDYRVSRFLDEPQRYPLVIPDYFRAGLWREHGCRGATFLFLRWCTDQFGTPLLRDMAQQPALGIHNLEEATGESFADLYRLWTLALAEPSRKAFPSVDLYGSLGQWPLAGPRHLAWRSGSGSNWQEVKLRGTSTAFFDLQRTGTSSRQRFEIRASQGTRLQVTLVRRPAHWPRISVDASLEFAHPVLPETELSSSDVSSSDVSSQSRAAALATAFGQNSAPADRETAGSVATTGVVVNASSPRFPTERTPPVTTAALTVTPASQGRGLSNLQTARSKLPEASPTPRAAFVRLRIAPESSLQGWHLESVTWERNQGEEQRCIPVPLAAAHRFVQLPLTDAEGCTLPAQLKIRLRDTQGRPAAIWVTLAPQPTFALSSPPAR